MLIAYCKPSADNADFEAMLVRRRTANRRVDVGIVYTAKRLALLLVSIS